MNGAHGEAVAGEAGTRLRGLWGWPERVGLAAAAWGMFFAAQHLYWFVAGRFEVGASGQDTWSVGIAGVFSVLLFALLALYPVALAWPFRWIGQRRVEIALLTASFAAMISLNLCSFLFSWSGFGLYPVGICVVGGLVAFARPRRLSVPHWMVLVATWASGAGMTLYGGAYVYAAFFGSSSETFLTYLLIGGLNWTVEGLLFLATAWLAGRQVFDGATGATAKTGRRG